MEAMEYNYVSRGHKVELSILQEMPFRSVLEHEDTGDRGTINVLVAVASVAVDEVDGRSPCNNDVVHMRMTIGEDVDPQGEVLAFDDFDFTVATYKGLVVSVHLLKGSNERARCHFTFYRYARLCESDAEDTRQGESCERAWV